MHRDSDAPLVTIIVRSMARESLAAALASCAAQTYRPLEVIVVAAAGPAHPALPEVACDGPMRLVRSGKPLPRAAAANAGLAAARGEWLGFLDDDDVFLPEHVAGLMAARAHAPNAAVLHCYGRSVFADGSAQRIVGQPNATIELFERNYVALPTALFSRALVERGCRFDEAFEILEDWDFLIQLAQHTAFAFVPQHSFVWHADRGTSGAGGGANYDAARFAHLRQRVREKWSAQRRALGARVKELLGAAEQHAARNDAPRAEECCRAALAISQNDPAVLNCLAIVRQRSGDLAGARAALEMANAVRPDDAPLLHNLALLCAAQGDLARARACVERALAADAAFEPARELQMKLQAHPG